MWSSQSQASASIHNVDSPTLLSLEGCPVSPGMRFMQRVVRCSFLTAAFAFSEPFEPPMGGQSFSCPWDRRGTIEGQAQSSSINPLIQPFGLALHSVGPYLPAVASLSYEHLNASSPSMLSTIYSMSPQMTIPSPGPSSYEAPVSLDPTAVEQQNQHRAESLSPTQRAVYDDVECDVPLIKRNFLSAIESIESARGEQFFLLLSGLFYVTELPKTPKGRGRRAPPMDYRCLLCPSFWDTRKDKVLLELAVKIVR